MSMNSCGLEGSVAVFTHVDSERRTCWGRLSDWNENRCGSEAKLTLKLKGQCSVIERMSSSSSSSSATSTADGYVQQGLSI